MYSYGPSHMAKQKQDDQLEHTYSSYVRIQDVALKTYQRQWMLGRSGERGSGISVLTAWHEDDDEMVSIFYKKNFYLHSVNRSNNSISNNLNWHKSFLFTKFKRRTLLFDSLIGLYHVLPLRVRVHLIAMNMKVYSTSPRALGLEPCYHMV